MSKLIECEYGLGTLPEKIVYLTGERDEQGLLVFPQHDSDTVKWSGSTPIPTIGTRVKINFNELGAGIIHSYFIEHGYLGLRVTLDKKTRPAWHKKQNPGKDYALVFGIEITVEENI